MSNLHTLFRAVKQNSHVQAVVPVNKAGRKDLSKSYRNILGTIKIIKFVKHFSRLVAQNEIHFV